MLFIRSNCWTLPTLPDEPADESLLMHGIAGMLRIRIIVALQVCLLFLSPICSNPSPLARQANNYGPEVKSFLELMRHEDDELEYQIHHNEISRSDYARAKNRIAIHRQAVLNLVKESGADVVPELDVVTAAELDSLTR